MYVVDDSPAVLFGGTPLWSRQLPKNILALGSPGTGKTCLLNTLRQQALTSPTPIDRALINDCKTEDVAILRSLGLEPTVLHPYDQRCVYPDLGAMVGEDPAGAPRLIANALLPKSSADRQPHFIESARLVVAGVIRALHGLAPRAWAFDDLVCVLRSLAGAKLVLRLRADTTHLAARFNDSEEFASVFATISTLVDRMDVLAAGWRLARKAGRTVNLKTWATVTPEEHRRVLLLGNDDARKESTQAAARITVALLTSFLLSSDMRASDDTRTLLILDEFPDLGGRISDSFPQFLATARSRGIATWLGAQTAESFKRDWGIHDAGVILGCMGNLAAFKVLSPETAEWLSRLAGDEEVWSVRYSTNNQGTTVNEGPETRRAILPSQFLDLPYPSMNSGHTAYYFYDRYIWRYTTPSSEWPPLPEDRSEDYLPVPAQDLVLTPLTMADIDRLNLPDDLESLVALNVAKRDGPIVI